MWTFNKKIKKNKKNSKKKQEVTRGTLLG